MTTLNVMALAPKDKPWNEGNESLQTHARLAAHFGTLMKAELQFDRMVATILGVEEWTPSDPYWLARRAAHHGLMVLRPLWALQEQLCQRCQTPLRSADERISGLCDLCILDAWCDRQEAQ